MRAVWPVVAGCILAGLLGEATAEVYICTHEVPVYRGQTVAVTLTPFQKVQARRDLSGARLLISANGREYTADARAFVSEMSVRAALVNVQQAAESLAKRQALLESRVKMLSEQILSLIHI